MWDDKTQSWVYDVDTEPKCDKKTDGSTKPSNGGSKKSTNSGSSTGKKSGTSSLVDKVTSLLPKTGEELSYWLSYAIIGIALIKVGKTLRDRQSES